MRGMKREPASSAGDLSPMTGFVPAVNIAAKTVVEVNVMKHTIATNAGTARPRWTNFAQIAYCAWIVPGIMVLTAQDAEPASTATPSLAPEAVIAAANVRTNGAATAACV